MGYSQCRQGHRSDISSPAAAAVQQASDAPFLYDLWSELHWNPELYALRHPGHSLSHLTQVPAEHLRLALRWVVHAGLDSASGCIWGCRAYSMLMVATGWDAGQVKLHTAMAGFLVDVTCTARLFIWVSV
jgi:hypothetical protein